MSAIPNILLHCPQLLLGSDSCLIIHPVNFTKIDLLLKRNPIHSFVMQLLTYCRCKRRFTGLT